MSSFVRPPGLSQSGDNHALNHKTGNMTARDASHIAAPPKCTFNSEARFVPHQQGRQKLFLESSKPIFHQEHHLSLESYHEGDLIAHVVGIDNKVKALQLLLELSA